MSVDIDDLHEKIGRWSPGFMRPRSIILLNALPLTPNGKFDRLALPHPEPEQVQYETQQVAPRNSTEEMLTAIWCEVLHVDKVGVYDDFFDLGGHSLSATRIINRVKKVRGVKLSLLQIFDHPTIAELAESLDSQ